MALHEKVQFYHSLGFNQDEILQYLSELNNVVISKRTLKRVLSSAHLYRRKHYSDLLEVALFLEGNLETADKLHGYKLMHLQCIQSGYTVTQETVRLLLQIIDPQGVQLRRRGRLRRRIYSNPGPDFMWHIDSYDKLKPYGICINGCIDGFSRHIIWLEAYSTNSDPAMLMYTSLRPDMFKAIDAMMRRFPIKYIDGWTPSFISQSDQLLMSLMKLTMNTPLLDLAERFNTSATSVNNIVTSQICALHEVLFKGLVERNIPSLQKCKGSMPTSFGDFSSCRIVLDATEITQDVPGNDMRLQASTYSGYTNSHTVKSVTGVAPNGALVFASKLYPGSTSDVALVEHCGILHQMSPGDMILADKGFTIHKLLPQGVHLNIPPFLTAKSQYTPAEVQLCRKIAKSRIHVERANERIKNYEILRHIQHQFRYISTKIFQLWCVLVNFQDPLLQEVAQNFVPENN